MISKIEDFLSSFPFPTLAIDTEGAIKHVSTYCCSFLNYDRETLLGKKVEVLIPDRLKLSHIKAREEFQSKGVEGRHPNGRLLPIVRGGGEEELTEIGLSPPIMVEGEQLVFVSFLGGETHDIEEILKVVKNKLNNINNRLKK